MSNTPTSWASRSTSPPRRKSPSPTTPKPVTRVHAIKERAALEIVFPRVSGYRRDLPSEKLEAVFTEDSRLEITPADIGPTSVVMEGIVGAGVTITPQVLERLRPSEISFNLAKHLLYTSFRDEDGFPKQHLFPQIQRLARRWLDEGYLVTKGVPVGAILYQDQLARAAEKIDIACTRASEGRIVAVLDPYNPKGSTRHVNFITSKPCWKTGAQPPKSQISHVVLDSDWEEQLAQTLETHPRVLAYAKNQALGFEIPYLDRGVTRRYLPDFLVRLDDGGDEPLNLVLEVKGIKDESDKAKAQTTRDLWVSQVRNPAPQPRPKRLKFLENRFVFAAAVSPEKPRAVRRSGDDHIGLVAWTHRATEATPSRREPDPKPPQRQSAYQRIAGW